MRKVTTTVCVALWAGFLAPNDSRGDVDSRRALMTGEVDSRMIQKQVTVSANLADVWRAWTTTEGVTSFGPPKANIELRIGGPYEWYFQPNAPTGSRGSEGCTVLSYLPMQMISFSWNAPPSIPKLRAAGPITHVVVRFEQVEPGKVKVKLTQLGFGVGDDWNRYYKYFERAWGSVLNACKEKVTSQPTTSTQRQRKKVGMKQFLIMLEPARGDTFFNPTNDEKALFVEHYKYLQALLGDGRLILAGMCQDGPPGIVVLEAEDQDAAHAIILGDPAVQAGLFNAEVRPYKVSLMREP